MNNMTLGEKITFLVTEFHKNPQPFIALHEAQCQFTHHLHDNTIYDECHYEFVSATLGGSILLSTGDVHNQNQNERWHWIKAFDDIVIFSPNSTYNDDITYQVPFGGERRTFTDFLTHEYTEEEMFQYSTVLSNGAWETLELFVYLKEHCTVPFKMNLSNTKLDLAVEVYKNDNIIQS